MRENGFRIYFQFREKSATSWINMEKIQKLFITLFAQKKPERKKIDVTFSLTRCLHKLRKINQTINPKFGLGYEREELK